jgi:hypothetical protein
MYGGSGIVHNLLIISKNSIHQILNSTILHEVDLSLINAINPKSKIIFFHICSFFHG